MVSAADLLAAYNALSAQESTYWFNQLTVDSNGLLIAPTDQTYFLLRVADDPANHDLDGEAYSRPTLTVQAWDTRQGYEWAARDTADTALTAIGWERIRSTSIQTDGTRYGVSTDYETTA